MHFGLLGIFQNYQGRETDEDLIAGEMALAKLAETKGFDSYWAVEHRACIRTQHEQPGTPTSRAAALWVAQGRVCHRCHKPVARGTARRGAWCRGPPRGARTPPRPPAAPTPRQPAPQPLPAGEGVQSPKNDMPNTEPCSPTSVTIF